MSKDLRAAPAAIVALARGLAEAHPGAALPCPVCAKEVRGDELARHLAGHGALAQATDPAVAWTGVDRWIGRVAVVPLLLWMVGLGALVGLAFNGVDLGAVGFFSLIGWFVLALAGLVVANVEVLKARLTLDGEVLRLRHSLGLRTVEVRLPAALEAGTLRGPMKGDMSDSPMETDVGVYLRLMSGGREIVVGCIDGPALGRHWDPRGWRRGGSRKRWGVTLRPPEFVALAYALAGRELLALRSA